MSNILGSRILVAAFDGWNDAGEAATGAVRTIGEGQAFVNVHAVDPEVFFDYQYARPTSYLDGTGQRQLRWPEAVIRRPAKRAKGTELLTLKGVEPARSWQAFAAELIDVALREDVTGFISMGSMLSDVPHTRPISIFSSSQNDAVRGALGLDRSTYEGPVGIMSVLEHVAEEAGIPTASLWASVPHYVATAAPSPKASLALLDRLQDLTGADTPREQLARDAATWEASIDAAAADDEDMTEYIRQLEHNRDAWDSPEASGDSIAREFERYLRRGSDGDHKR